MPEAFNRSVDEVLRALEVDPDAGLSERDARRRFQQHCENRLPRAKRKSAWKILADQFALLFAAAAASLASARS